MMSDVARKLVVAIPFVAMCMKGGVAVEAQMSVALLVALAVILAAVYGRPISSIGWVVGNTSFLVAFLSLYVLLQAYIPAWSSHALEIWAAVENVTGHKASFVSLAPADTVASVVAITNPILLFCSGLLLCGSDRSAKSMIDALVTGGGVLVLGTLVLFLVEPRSLLIWEREHYFGSFTATFVNRNTAATFIGLVTIMLVAQIMRRANRKVFAALHLWFAGERVGSDVRREVVRAVTDAGLFIACALGLVLTLSRAGIASTLIALISLFCLRSWAWGRQGQLSSDHHSRGFQPWLMLLVGIVCLLVLASLLTGLAQLRIAAGIVDDARFCIYPAVISAISDSWPFGAGFGAFAQSFAAYQPAACGLDGTWERAHNFFLEGMLGLGIVFAPLLFLAIWTLGRAFCVGIVQRQRERVYPVAGIAVLILVICHSALDFSLQIPGFSLYFAAVLAPLVVLSLGRHKGHRRELAEG